MKFHSIKFYWKLNSKYHNIERLFWCEWEGKRLEKVESNTLLFQCRHPYKFLFLLIMIGWNVRRLVRKLIVWFSETEEEDLMHNSECFKEDFSLVQKETGWEKGFGKQEGILYKGSRHLNKFQLGLDEFPSWTQLSLSFRSNQLLSNHL